MTEADRQARFDRATLLSCALKSAFETQVALLFTNLCDAHDDPAAVKRFDLGFEIAQAVYDAEMSKIDGDGSKA